MTPLPDIIAACPLFAHLDHSALDAVAACARRVKLSRGDIIFHTGDPCRGFYLVEDGMVKVFRLSAEGRESILHLVGPREVFAEAALFADRDYPAHAEMIESGHLLLIQRDPFLLLLQQHFEVARGVLAGMSVWLRRLVDQVETLALEQAPQRLARYLIELPMLADGDRRYLQLPARKYLIAGQLNMTAPTLSRCLTRLEAAGLIQVDGRRVYVLEPAGLGQLADAS